MKYITMISLMSGCAVLLRAMDLGAGPIDAGHHPHPEKAQVVHEAGHRVDQAWEIYHRAALGGTIASPGLQATIEQHLHEARTLLSQAQDAVDRGEIGKLERVVDQITVHTIQAIEGSKQQKQ